MFKSLELIPDGVEDLGLLDDAFVLRVSAALAADGVDGAPEVVARLARDAELVDEFLGEEAPRLRRYVEELQQLAVRGRSPEQIVTDADARDATANDIAAWANSYKAPPFAPDEKNLVKLRSFMATKLPKPLARISVAAGKPKKINSGRVIKEPPPARTLRTPATAPTSTRTGICQK